METMSGSLTVCRFDSLTLCLFCCFFALNKRKHSSKYSVCTFIRPKTLFDEDIDVRARAVDACASDCLSDGESREEHRGKWPDRPRWPGARAERAPLHVWVHGQPGAYVSCLSHFFNTSISVGSGFYSAEWKITPKHSKIADMQSAWCNCRRRPETLSLATPIQIFLHQLMGCPTSFQRFGICGVGSRWQTVPLLFLRGGLMDVSHTQQFFIR